MSLVSVIIANRNRKTYLRSCLDSLFKQTYGSIETIVVDNGSEDDSQQMLKEEFAQVKLIANEDNLFYCQAQNQGIRIAKGEYLICLNNDVVLEKDFISETLKAANIDQGIGMVCGKIISWDRQTIDSAGQILGRSRKPVERGYKKQDTGRFDRPGYIFSAGGVAPLYRRKMLEEIKVDGEYFDESYGMFYEDLDIAWRANLFGWKGFYTPRAMAYHRRGGTAKVYTPRIGFLKRYDFVCLPAELKISLIKNRYMTILKNDCKKDFIINLPWIIAHEIKLWAYIIFFNPHLIMGIIRNFHCLKTALKKRAKIRQLKRQKPSAIYP
ncbi:MAG: glycosyltransferase family 2 protein [Candidatus Omnitrophota bacterium]